MYENRDGNTANTPADPTPEERRQLQIVAQDVADQARRYLSDAFTIESGVMSTPMGAQAAITVYLPETHPVTAGIAMDEIDEFSSTDEQQMATELVATAIGQARASGDADFLPAAR